MIYVNALGYAQIGVALPRGFEFGEVLHEPVFLITLQDHRFQQPRDVTLHPPPVLIEDKQRRIQTQVFFMGGHDLIDEPPKKRLPSTHGSESQRLVPLDRTASRLRASVEIHRKGSSPIPEPVPSRRWNHGQSFTTQGCV